MIKKSIFAFLANIALLVVVGYVSIDKLKTLSDLNEELYEHPFVVSNATKTIQTNVVSMHRYMKDVASAESAADIEKAKELVDANQKIIFEEFALIFEKYLGDKKEIQKSYDTFVAWEPIRNEVIALTQNKKKREAYAITKGKGAEYIANLDKEINTLIVFAKSKADSFHQKNLKAASEAVRSIIVLLVVIVFLSLSVFIILLRSISKRDVKIEEYFNVIDENIMSVVVDDNHKILAASSALAKYLKLSKEELLDAPNYFLFSESSPEQRFDLALAMRNGDSWKGEVPKNVGGETKWLEVSAHPMKSDKKKFANILIDVTDKKKFEKLSKTDSLTNLYNRRYFNSIFPKMIKISKRKGLPLVFAMIDIDFFKQYNDIYGHQMGDEALSEVAKTMRAHANRPDDYAFRIGGEEFAILFSVKKEEDALEFMEKLLEKIENSRIEHRGNKASEFLTISMGMYIIKDNDDASVDQLYKRADDLLYQAKENGRNRVRTNL